MDKFLRTIERLGNKLPDVTILFLCTLVLAMFCSFALSFVDFSYHMPNGGEKIVVKNMLHPNEIFIFLSKLMPNFISFPPLVVVLTATIGMGVMEASGFLRVLLIKIAGSTPRALLTPVIIFISIICHVIADSTYIFLMPIAAALFAASGKHPVAGLAAAFAGLGGAFCASFLPSIVDPLLQQLTEKAAHIIDADVKVNVLCNYFLSFSSAFILIFCCWFMSERVVEPFLNKNLPIDQNYEKMDFSKDALSDTEKRAFRAASWTFIIMAVIVIAFAWPSDSPLRGANGSLTAGDGILMKGIVAFLFFFMALPGYVFGRVTGKYKSFSAVSSAMSESLQPLVGFIVFAFVCGQFLYVFNHSNLSKLLAVSGAELLKSMHMPGGFTLFGVIVFTGLLNLIIVSASSKWSVLASIFVPMLMLLGISPELTQAAFKVSDSAMNIVTPLFPFYPLLIAYCRKYCSTTGIGTMMSMMIPYSIMMMVVLTGMLYAFWIFDIPMGFESSYSYAPNAAK